ncbi:MAG: tetratricopeptide repeat protein [Bacteroidetes bacterium]|nr:tetratricopeptide repeat protein [Bacteroidota bacterium]
MKRFSFLLLLFSQSLFAQSRVDSLIRAGVEYHDAGSYLKAISSYQKAIELNPESGLAHYELAYSAMLTEDYELAQEHAEIVIDLDESDILSLSAYNILGSSLDERGEVKKSIKVYKKALRKFDDHYLLAYNLALDYFNINEFDEAEEVLQKGILNNPSHSSSHLLLAGIKKSQRARVESLLAFHTFLLLEPNSARSPGAYNQLMSQFGAGVSRDPDKPNQINISLSPSSIDSDFSSANMMISMLMATNSLDENKDLSEQEKFVKNTTTFFEIVGEMGENDSDDFWNETYTRFYYKLAQSDYMTIYGHYIAQSENSESEIWILEHQKETNDFLKWVEENF